MTYKKISIIIPSLNQGHYIEKTLLSIFNQEYPSLEVIVIDGQSKDNTINIIKKYENKIVYWVSERDRGQSHAINKGLKKATGDIIAWINSDDIYFPKAFHKVNTFFEINSDVDIVYGNGVWIDEMGKIIKYRQNLPFHYNTWFYGMADPFQPEVFYRRKVLDIAGYLDESFSMMMDREWWIRMANCGLSFRHFDSNLAALRKYDGTKTSQFLNRNELERWRLHDKYWTGYKFKTNSLHKLHWLGLNYFYRSFRFARCLLHKIIKFITKSDRN